MPTVVVIGNYGNGNTGDEAILARIAELAGDHVNLQVLVKDVKSARIIHPYTAVIERKSLHGVRTLLKSDVIAIGGGGMFGEGMPWLVRVLPFVGIGATLTGKKVVFIAIGAYPGMPKDAEISLQLLARRAHTVTVRDMGTAEFLAKRLSKSAAQPIVVEDPAHGLTLPPPNEILDFLNRTTYEQAKTLIISLKPAISAADNLKMVHISAHVADQWIKQTDGHVSFMCMSVRGDFGYEELITDRTLAQDAISKMTQKSSATILGPNLSPRIAKGIIANSAGVFGARLHTLIFAHASGVPVFGMIFETKTKLYAAENNISIIESPFEDIAPVEAWVNELSRQINKTSIKMTALPEQAVDHA